MAHTWIGLLGLLLALLALAAAQNDGRRSLTFVFDSTGSMDDDLDAVKSGIRRIAASYAKFEHISNFILIKVHDPDVSEPLITSKITTFYKYISDIFVQGGGDCPEMTVSGIEKALLSSDQHSSIFVFTDGSAKDHMKTDGVLNLIQKTQSQVTFVMTGDCDNQTSPEFLSFLKISSMSSGQIFHIKKKQVKEFLKVIELVIQTRKVNILVQDADTNGSAIYNPPVDTTINRLVVSVVATDVNTQIKVNIRDKDGKILKKDVANGVKEEMQEVKSTFFGTVNNPTPGPWSIEVLSSGKHTIRVTGQSPLDFFHGFHTNKVTKIEETYRRPLKGVPSYIFINMTAPLPSGTVNRVDLLTVNGTRLGTLNVVRSKVRPNLFTTVTPYVPPAEQFYIKVTGKDNQGEAFQRFTPTGISTRDPERPMVTCKQKQMAKRGETYKIGCTVKSDISYNIQWYLNNKPIGTPNYSIKQPGEVFYTITNANEDSEGVYRCNASNTAGASVDHVTFKVLPPPPNIMISKNVTAAPGDRIQLTCTVYSPNPGQTNVRWFQIYKGLPLVSSRRKQILTDRSGETIVSKLIIPEVSRGDEGAYLCEAGHEGGNTTKSIFLTVQVLPQVFLDAYEINYKRGDNIELFCRAEGIPPPKVSWEFRGSAMLPSPRVLIDGGRLILRDAQFSDTGDYVCVASSEAGEARGNVTVSYTEKPIVEIQKETMQAVLDHPVEVKCVARGVPRPKIRWERNGLVIKDDSPAYSYDEMGTLTINRVTPEMAGAWTCVAENTAGTSMDSIEISVGTPPKIAPMPPRVNVTYGLNVTLYCKVMGSPKPKIEWLRGVRPDFRPLPFNGKYTLGRDNSLIIRDVKLGDKGYYTCMARNSINADSKSVQVLVTGMKPPVLAYLKAEQTALEGDRKRIKCTVTESKPEANIIWMRNGMEMKSTGRVLVRDGLLMFNKVEAEDEGQYMCVAKNEMGKVSWKINLDVQTRPTIIGKRKENIEITQGKKLTLNCKSKGDPPPTLDWTKDGGPINYADTAYNLLEDSSLEIYSITKAHQGFYMCTAKNKNSMDTKEIKVTVLTPPRINRDGGDTVEVRIGKAASLPCRIVDGYPLPQVAWYRDSKKIVPIPGRIVISTSRTLEVYDAVKQDAGPYECRATNKAGSDSRMFNLDVILPPQVRNDTQRKRVVVKGQDITLRCLVNAYPRPNITWYFDNNRLTPRQLFKMSAKVNQADQTLVIRNTSLLHDGEFKCVATNRGGTVDVTVDVEVTIPPKINQNLPNTTVSLTESPILLTCPANGSPTPNITWFFENKKISHKDKNYRYTAEGSLVIDSADLFHGGNYKCVAENTAGSDTRRISVFVVDDGPGSVGNVTDKEGRNGNGAKRRPTVRKGGNITFTCVVKSTPPAIIKWYKDGVPIWKAMAKNRYILNKNASSLTLLNVRPTAKGRFSCVAVNIPGNGFTRNFTLTVELSPFIINYKSSPSRVVVREGEAIQLKCVATAEPSPKMRWYKDNRLIMPTDSEMNLRSDDSELIIMSAQAKHAGNYACEAYNRVGKQSKKIKVIVEVPPEIKDADKLERPKFIVGEEARLRCEVSKGLPLPDIVWTVDQTIAFPGETYGMDDLNQVLIIRKVDQSHGTRISCKAVNKIGEARKFYDPILLSPPVISKTSDLQQVVVEKRTIILSCYIERGNPRPNITWYRDGEELKPGLFPNIRLRSQGSQLHLSNAKRSDAALYKCVATNPAGKDEITFTLEVQVPAYIELSTPDKTPEIVLGRQLALFCMPKGNPEPSMKWLKDNQPVNPGRVLLRNGDKELIINSTTEKDSGRYTCRASNTIGMDSQNFDVAITYAPRLTPRGKRQYVWRMQTGGTVSLECPVIGNPKPKIEWLKDGAPLQTSDRVRYRNNRLQVEILNVGIGDQAKFTCVAENSIGSLEVTNIVDVGRRPTIDKTLLQLEYKIAEGKTLIMSCPASGTPRPHIQFHKDGKKLGVTPGFIVSQTEQTLRILSIRKQDSGMYRCMAGNSAGRVAVDYKVTVLIPPRIDDANLVSKLRWLVGQARTIECPLMGVSDPPAIIRWMRDGSPLLDGPGIQVSPDQRRVSVAAVTLADAGDYSCIATNDVASITQEFKVKVLMKPKFDDRNLKFVHTVVQNSTVLIDCSARAVPEPKYEWERGGRFLSKVYMDVNKMRIINNGRRLEILNAQGYDSTNYSCTALNDAGYATRNFVVKVIVPPQIDRSRQVPVSVDIQENQPMRLNCSIAGGLAGDTQITWYKDGSPILVSSASDVYRVVDGGLGLVILSPSSEDSGRYRCRASNKAGFAKLDYTVNVIVPPYFPRDFSRFRKDEEVRVNEPVILRCPAEGSPDPIITWYKDGRLTDSTTQYVRIQDNGKVFELLSTLTKDKGRYHCTAVNAGGRIRKDYNLMVMEPPMVRIPYEKLEPREGSPYFEIRCSASGDPKPTITWLKDGSRLATSSRIVYNNEGTLVLRAVRGDDSGRYTCTASNRIGKDSKSVIVNVLRPPKIVADKRIVKAVLGQRAFLPCRAQGSPKPSISWEHDSFPVDQGSPGYAVSETALTVLSVEERHKGRYSCVAKSSAGADVATITLKVVVPPAIISTSPTKVKQYAENDLSLQCLVRGDPEPKVWWERNGQRITRDDLRYRVLSGYLLIPRLTEDDIGQFMCVAENEAGRKTHSFEINVLVKPEARIPRQMYTHNLGDTAQIVCNVRGRPKPTVMWTKDGRNVMSASPRYSVLQESILRITGIKEEDEGTFRCQADSEAGYAHADTMLRIRTPPKFRETPPAKIEVNENGFKDLSCLAEGRPPPRIQFFHNGTRLSHNPSSGGWGRYTIRNARSDSAGQYTCVAVNPAGRKEYLMRVRIIGRPRVFVIQSDQAVQEKAEALLRCDVKGENFKIVWLKDDEQLKNSSRIMIAKDGYLIIKDATLRDTGTYRCLATNEAGQDEGKVVLTINSQPKFSLQPANSTTVRGRSTLLPCLAESHPRPKVMWYKDRKELAITARHTLLANGSLMIVGASAKDAGVYQCVAKNRYGEAHSTMASLKVVVHGSWGSWGDWSQCSKSCSSGQRTRVRKCDNPKPENGGRSCQGRPKESVFCLISFCPVNGGWSAWTKWSRCSASCGAGIEMRSRRCDSPPAENGGDSCHGEAQESRVCNTPACPVHGAFGPWTPWTACSVSCGVGMQNRRRLCNAPAPSNGGRPCTGLRNETRPCGLGDCPIDGGWGEWKPWSECSESCGGGFTRRERLCNKPPPSATGRYCDGDRYETKRCKEDVPCPVSGNWSPWSSWSPCSFTCGSRGRQSRTRTCTNPAPRDGGRPCRGTGVENRICGRRSCPVGVFTEWSNWSPCSVSCGRGVTQRTRQCVGPEQCNGGTRQTKVCEQNCSSKDIKAAKSVLGRITGIINKNPIGVITVNGDWSVPKDKKRMDYRVKLDNVRPSQAGCIQALAGMLSPLHWLAAYEVNKASNGHTVTSGSFRRDSEVQFASGAILKMTHHVSTSADGILALNTVLRGGCPDYLTGPIKISGYVEKYVQLKPGRIFAQSSNAFRAQDRSQPYAWNHTVTYDTNRTQRYVTQKMVVEEISVSFERPIQRINFRMSAIIAAEGQTCPKGFKLVAKKYCADEDECSSGKHKCAHICHNQAGGYTCSCRPGFVLSADGRDCKDDNECTRGSHNCNRRNQQCVNTVGSFKCIFKCGEGLRSAGDGQCLDIDECAERKSICGRQICKNTYGSYRCICKLGFRKAGSKCIDIDECAAAHPCEEQCVNLPGSFRCSCPKGLKLVDQYRCVDVDECWDGSHNCSANKFCLNSRGSYKCIDRCPVGFKFSQSLKRCVDVDECLLGTHRCVGLSQCVNTQGSFRCDCPKGYRKINGVCKDINECRLDPKPCAYRCLNTKGDYECLCPPGSKRLPDKKSCEGFGGQKCRPGYEFIHGRGCIDIDECRSNSTCQWRCVNEAGGHRCYCPEGYRVGRKGRCIDINECVINRRSCNSDKICLNTKGSFHCVRVVCPTGYTFDPYRRVCKVLCSQSNLTCPANSRYAETVIFTTASFPSGRRYSAARVRVRNSAGTVLKHCGFVLLDKTPDMPFAFKEKDGTAIIYTTETTKPTTNLYFMRFRAACYKTEQQENLVYQNSFFVYVSVSKYPF